jgi:hypothetical protein
LWCAWRIGRGVLRIRNISGLGPQTPDHMPIARISKGTEVTVYTPAIRRPEYQPGFPK